MDGLEADQSVLLMEIDMNLHITLAKDLGSQKNINCMLTSNT